MPTSLSQARGLSGSRVSILTATTSKFVAAELCLQRVERRHLLAAGHAPGGPEVEQHRAAAPVGERALAARRIVEGEVGQPQRLLADGDRGHLAARQRRDALRPARPPARRRASAAIALERADPVYRRQPDRRCRASAARRRSRRARVVGDGSGVLGHESVKPRRNLLMGTCHEQQDVGRAFRVRPRRHHGGDQRLDRFRPAPLPPGHRRKQGPCRDARQAGHHLGATMPRRSLTV